MHHSREDDTPKGEQSEEEPSQSVKAPSIRTWWVPIDVLHVVPPPAESQVHWTFVSTHNAGGPPSHTPSNQRLGGFADWLEEKKPPQQSLVSSLVYAAAIGGILKRLKCFECRQ